MAAPFYCSVQELLEEAAVATPMVLCPWLPVNGLGMLAGPTGVGKTMVALAIALAIASGGEVLGWTAPEPRGVLYVDGEMAVIDMKQRMAALIVGMGLNEAALRLFFLCDAEQEEGLGSLVSSSRLRQDIERIMEHEGLEVLILDNLSALCNAAEENDAESWTVMQDWLIEMRRKGYTILFLHHTGKPNDRGYVRQRGTSKREDVLNTSIIMVPKEAGFQIVFTKHRGFVPSQFELYGKIVWDLDKGEAFIQGTVAAGKVKDVSIVDAQRIMMETA